MQVVLLGEERVGVRLERRLLPPRVARIIDPALFGAEHALAHRGQLLVDEVAQPRQVVDPPVGRQQHAPHPRDRLPGLGRAVARAGDHELATAGPRVAGVVDGELEDLLADPLLHLVGGDRLAGFDHAGVADQRR